MNESDVLYKVIGLIMTTGGLTRDEVKSTSHLENDLGFDLLDMVELTMSIEEEFSLEYIEDEDSEKWTVVSDIVNYLKGKVPACK